MVDIVKEEHTTSENLEETLEEIDKIRKREKENRYALVAISEISQEVIWSSPN